MRLARGRNRVVVLTRRHAYKLPTPTSWPDFLFGLLNNMNEARRGKRGQQGYCPVVFALPGGWLTVMLRARPMLPAEWEGFDAKAFCSRLGIKAEHKPCSFGWLNGRIVAVDYGW
jgi:hypothetical protein